MMWFLFVFIRFESIDSNRHDCCSVPQSYLLVDHISTNLKQVGLNQKSIQKVLLAFQKVDNSKVSVEKVRYFVVC
jgi:hypothetical protein